jgi:hypothetical protein
MRNKSNRRKMVEEIDHNLCLSLGTMATTMAAARFGLIGSADAQSDKTNPAKVPTIQPGTNSSFGALKQIDAGLLNVGDAEAGSARRPAVILPYGWAYDIHSYLDGAPLLASKGYRVIVPCLRGYGTTRAARGMRRRGGGTTAIRPLP